MSSQEDNAYCANPKCTYPAGCCYEMLLERTKSAHQKLIYTALNRSLHMLSIKIALFFYDI